MEGIDVQRALLRMVPAPSIDVEAARPDACTGKQLPGLEAKRLEGRRYRGSEADVNSFGAVAMTTAEGGASPTITGT